MCTPERNRRISVANRAVSLYETEQPCYIIAANVRLCCLQGVNNRNDARGKALNHRKVAIKRESLYI